MTTYSDLNTKFNTSNAELNSIVYDLNSIKQNIERLLMTPKGSVPFNREYGTTLYSLLFENNVDPADIVAFIYADIEDNEPRVELSPADIYIYKTDRNTYEVNVTFTVPSLNNVTSSVSTKVSENKAICHKNNSSLYYNSDRKLKQNEVRQYSI